MTIAEDADGRMLFGTFGGGIAVYDGRGFQVYTTEHGLPSNEIVGLQATAGWFDYSADQCGRGLVCRGPLHKVHNPY